MTEPEEDPPPLLNPNPDLEENLEDGKAIKRLDRTVSGYEGDFYLARTIKMRLQNFLRINDPNKLIAAQSQKMLSTIQQNVSIINHIAFLVYHFLNFHILRMLDQGLPLPHSIDQDYVQVAYVAVSYKGGHFNDSKKAKEEPWKESISQFREIMNQAAGGTYPFPDRALRSLLCNTLSKTIATAISNHLELNFNQRLYKYLKLTQNESDGAKAHYWADRILNYRTVDPEKPCKFDDDIKSEEIIAKWKIQLSIPPDSKAKIKINGQLDVYLPIYQKFLKYFKEKEVKGFTLLPVKGEYGESFITIDSSSLAYLINQMTGQKGVKDIKAGWNFYVDLRKVETGKFRFGHLICTNGYEVSIMIKQQFKPFPPDYHLEWSLEEKVRYINRIREHAKAIKEVNQKPQGNNKKKEENPFLEIEWHEYLTVLGLDPGRRSLFTVYNPETHQKIQCTSPEWRQITGQTRHRLWRNKRKDQFKTSNKLNSISFKTGEFQVYLENIKHLVPQLSAVFQFYGQSSYKKRQFTQYIKTQKAYHQIIDRLDFNKGYPEKPKILIGFGSGAVNTNGCCKGAKVPSKSLFKEMKKRQTLYCGYVNEQYTTQRCFKCHHETLPIYGWKDITDYQGNVKSAKYLIYGLRRCSNNECRITWNRDCNASPNIRTATIALIKKEPRPPYLTLKGKLSNPLIEKRSQAKKKN